MWRSPEFGEPPWGSPLITAEVEVGRVYEGRVARLMDFGAFVTILPGQDGLVNISQISDVGVGRIKLKEGDAVRVKLLEIDRQGRVRLSMRDHDEKGSSALYTYEFTWLEFAALLVRYSGPPSNGPFFFRGNRL